MKARDIWGLDIWWGVHLTTVGDLILFTSYPSLLSWLEQQRLPVRFSTLISNYSAGKLLPSFWYTLSPVPCLSGLGAARVIAQNGFTLVSHIIKDLSPSTCRADGSSARGQQQNCRALNCPGAATKASRGGVWNLPAPERNKSSANMTWS